MKGKKHKPTAETRRLVETLAGYGVPQGQIGPLVGEGINEDTLCKWYRKELDVGVAKANANVGKTFYGQVTGENPNISALIWWTKSRMGWKETITTEHVGKDGGPIEIGTAREKLRRKLFQAAD